jgi:trigger factor
VSVTKEITRLEKSNVKLSLTVPKEEVQAQYQDVLREYTKNAQMPGFRKGKVPQEVLLRKFGESLKGAAIGKIIEKAVDEVFQDENLPRNERPLSYSQPVIQDEPQLDLDQDLSFSLVYDVLPAISIGQWKGLEVEVPQVEITGEDIDRELEEVRERNAFVLDRDEDAQAQSGDIVTINYCELGEGGEALAQSQRDDFVFTLGSRSQVYQFDDDITGMKKGETKEFSKTYPQADTAGDSADSANAGVNSFLAGRTVKFRVTLTAMKEKKLPDLDDELAQDVDEQFKTLDDLKKSIRERLEKSLALRIKDVKINKLLEKIMENTPVTLPESMIKVELEGRLRNLARRFNTDVENVVRMMGMTGENPNEIEQNWRSSAEKALHSRFIVETLMEEQHIEASDADVERELENIAADTGTPLEEVKKKYEEDNAREYIRETIREAKFFDALVAGNTIKTGSRVNYLDLMEKNG